MFKLINPFATRPVPVQESAPPCQFADELEGEGVDIERDAEKCGGSGCGAFANPAMWTPGSGHVPR